MLWSDEQFNIYAKHRVALDAKSRARKLRKSQTGKGKCSTPSSDSESVASASGVTGTTPPVPVDSGSHSGISESRVLSLIKEALGTFNKEMVSTLESSFASIESLIVEKEDERFLAQDVNLNPIPSTDNPPSAPVRPSPSQGSLDHSQ